MSERADAGGRSGTYCVPIHRTAEILTQKARMTRQNKLHFPLKTPDRCLNLLRLPCGRTSPGGGGCAGVVTGTLTYCWAPCPRRAEGTMRPLRVCVGAVRMS